MNTALREQLHVIEHLMNEGELEEAIAQLESLSEQDPKNYHIASLLGECYLTIGTPDKAIKPLKWAMKCYPEAVKERQKEEKVALASDAEKRMVHQLKKQFNRREKNKAWVDHYLLGCAYGRCMNFRNAIKHLNIADKMNPKNTEIIRNIGWIRCMQERKEDGRKLLRKAISIDPDNALAYNDLGASYLFEEDFDEAKKWINKALEMEPDDEFINNTADKLEELVAYKTIFKGQ